MPHLYFCGIIHLEQTFNEVMKQRYSKHLDTIASLSVEYKLFKLPSTYIADFLVSLKSLILDLNKI